MLRTHYIDSAQCEASMGSRESTQMLNDIFTYFAGEPFSRRHNRPF